MALVITIVILIILATVSIGVIFGEGGLIKRAQEAKNFQANAETEENKLMEDAESLINDVLGGEGESSGEKSLVQAFKDGDIVAGDYVNYKPEAHDPVTVGTSETGYTDSKGISGGTDQRFTQDPNTTWRVLGLSENGKNLLLTSGSPIKKDGEDPYLVLQGAAGAANCVEVLDKVSELYHNSELAEETRSMTIKDIERVLGGVTVEYPQEEHDAGKVYFTSDESKTLIGTTTPYTSYTYGEGEWKLENPPVKVTEVGEKVDADGYMFAYDYNKYKELGVDISQKAYDMLFAGTTMADNFAKLYWLASPGVFAISDAAIFGPGAVTSGFAASGGGDILFSSGGNWLAIGCAVRPVVVLRSDVQYGEGEGKIKKIEDKEEAKWSTQGVQLYGEGNLNAQ